jgi:hypothetical protein
MIILVACLREDDKNSDTSAPSEIYSLDFLSRGIRIRPNAGLRPLYPSSHGSSPDLTTAGATVVIVGDRPNDTSGVNYHDGF